MSVVYSLTAIPGAAAWSMCFLFWTSQPEARKRLSIASRAICSGFLFETSTAGTESLSGNAPNSITVQWFSQS